MANENESMDTGNEGTIIRIPLLLNITATQILFTDKQATTKHHWNVFYKASNFHIHYQTLLHIDECLVYLSNMRLCACMYLRVYMSVCACACVYTCVCVWCMRVCIHMCVCHACVCVYVCVCVRICDCMYACTPTTITTQMKWSWLNNQLNKFYSHYIICISCSLNYSNKTVRYVVWVSCVH